MQQYKLTLKKLHEVAGELTPVMLKKGEITLAHKEK